MANHSPHAVGHEAEDQFIRDRTLATNRNRITWVLSVFALVHLAHIALFWPYVPGATVNADVWRNGVIVVHAALVAFIAVISPLNVLLDPSKHVSRLVLGAIPEIVSLVYLFGGAALAIVDQRVTSSINPLLTAAVGVALVIIVRPLVALSNYVLVLTFFLVGVTRAQADTNLMLTLRVNSITAIGLGCGIALIQWRNQVLTLRQQRRIDEQQRELEEKNRELTLVATQDPLTGLLNRAQFVLDAKRAVVKMESAGAAACLVMMDVDDFKRINDTFGHPAGDSILLQIAGILTRMLRGTALLARFGGEEFTVLLPVASIEEAAQVAERLRIAIAQQSFSVGAESVHITASFGVAECPTASRDAFETAYRAADLALYQAKNDGRNCVRSKQALVS